MSKIDYDQMIEAGERLIVRQEKNGMGRFIWLPEKTYRNASQGRKAVEADRDLAKSNTFDFRDPHPKEIEAYKAGAQGVVDYSVLIHDDLEKKEAELRELRAKVGEKPVDHSAELDALRKENARLKAIAEQAATEEKPEPEPEQKPVRKSPGRPPKAEKEGGDK